MESVVIAARRSLLNLLRVPLWLLKGRAGFKERIASCAEIAAEHLPYREELINYLHEQKALGRKLILATAAHQSIANSVASHLKIFDDVLATHSQRNLKSHEKLRAIQQQVGTRFVYAGDSHADLCIWQTAEAAILVNVPHRLAQTVKRSVAIEREFAPRQDGLKIWFRALRVHQWLKNLLIFVPLLTAFSFTDFAKSANSVIAFFAFSLAASANYVINDLWDLENDRAHPRKRFRPFASGQLPISYGLVASAGCLLVALLLAAAVSKGFLLVLGFYLLLTSAYSWVFKEYVLVDVVLLSLLYTLRILAGAVAIGIAVSSWLLAFSVFIFLSLALVKRCTELVTLDDIGLAATRGRDYRVGDLAVLWPLGVGAAMAAVVVFGLFISAPETQPRYATPQLLWLVAVGLIYWLGRLWIKTSRGEMHDDPVVYAIKDRGSRLTVMAMVAAILAAHFISISSLL